MAVAERRTRAGLVGRGPTIVAVGFVIAVFALAAARLATRHWTPALDLAMTELRVRDVGTARTPLIGLPGRIGRFPEQGSHPGPLSFYALTPVYRLLGSSAWSLLAAAAVLAAGFAAGAIAVGARLGGRLLRLGVVAIVVTLLAGYGLNTLTQPWNPYLPLLAWCLVLMTTWAVLAGHLGLLVVVAVAASYCAQTHVSYLLLGGGMTALAGGAVVVAAIRRPTRRAAAVRSIGIAVAATFVVWIPPLLDQLVRDPGNLGVLRDHFTTPDQPVIGLRHGAALVLRNLDPWYFLAHDGSGDITDAGEWPAGSPIAGLVLVVVWLASAAVAVRSADRRLRALHLVVAVGLGLAVLDASRIFGDTWFYLTLWASALVPFMAAAVVGTAIDALGRGADRARPRTARTVALAAGVATSVVLGVALVVQALGVQPADHRLSEALRPVVGPTAEALATGPAGADGVYVVRWYDSYFFGAQFYGLVNELERRGFDVGAPEAWAVPLTRCRVTEVPDAAAVVVLATGGKIDWWSTNGDAVEVARHDARDDDQRAEFAALRTRLVDDLATLGLVDLIPTVDDNLFGVQLDPRLPDEQRRIVSRLLWLGQEVAVFVVPADRFTEPG